MTETTDMPSKEALKAARAYRRTPEAGRCTMADAGKLCLMCGDMGHCHNDVALARDMDAFVAPYRHALTETMNTLGLRTGERDCADEAVKHAEAERDALAAQVAALREALENVHRIISEGAAEGFNPVVNNWGDKLFQSQQKTYAALTDTAATADRVIREAEARGMEMVADRLSPPCDRTIRRDAARHRATTEAGQTEDSSEGETK